MSAGPRHYRDAWKLADAVHKTVGASRDGTLTCTETLLLAQVHATLALAAATAANIRRDADTVRDAIEWVEVLNR